NAEAPALLTRMSTPPRRVAACSTKPTHPARLRRSAGIGTTSNPVAREISSAVAFNFDSVRAQMATRTPSSLSLRAIASPMPSLAPVTSAVLPLSPSSIVGSLRLELQCPDDLGGPRARVDLLVPLLDLAVLVDHHADTLRALLRIDVGAVRRA